MSLVHDLPELLHDAQLVSIAWDAPHADLALTLKTLRREPAGGPVADENVVLRPIDLTAWFGIAFKADDEWHARFPIAPQPDAVTFLNLLRKSIEEAPAEVHVSVNAQSNVLSLSDCNDFTRLFGSEITEFAARPIRLGVAIGFHGDIEFFLGCSALDIQSGGERLSLEQWQQEHDAHWKQWNEYWDSQEEEEDDDEYGIAENWNVEGDDDSSEDDEHEVTEDDRAFGFNIPSVDDDAAKYAGYQPPDRPPFTAGDTDLPDEMSELLRLWFEARFRNDWGAMAHVYRDPDRTDDEQAEQFKVEFTEWSPGSWTYATAVKKWKIVGERAFVVLEGFTHFAPDPDEGEPASDDDLEFGACLRRIDGKWIIERIGI